MLFLKSVVALLTLNARYSCRIRYPIIEYQHATIFQTVALNNVADLITLATTDLVVAGFFYPLAFVTTALPQAVWHGGYLVCQSTYYLLADVDAAMAKYGFRTEQKRDDAAEEADHGRRSGGRKNY